MKQIILLCLVASSCVACATAHVARDNPDPIVQQYQSAWAIDVGCVDESGKFREVTRGSGVAVSTTEVVTAAHVVPIDRVDEFCAIVGLGASAIRGLPYPSQPSGETFKPRHLEFDRSDPDADVAVLKVQGAPIEVFAAAANELRPTLNERLCFVGGRVSFRYFRKCGRAQAWREGNIITTARVLGGNSGAGVYQGRELAGIVTGYFGDGEFNAIIVPVQRWAHLLGGE